MPTHSRSFPRSPARIALLGLAGAAGLVTLLLIVLTLALPGWITGRGAALASQALGRQVAIASAQVQPWRLAVVLDGLSIAGAGAGQPAQFSLGRLDAALSLRSLLRGRLVVESVSLSQPTLRLARISPGHYDIDDLIERWSKPAAPSSEPGVEFAVYNVAILDGRMDFEDRPVARRHQLSELQLALPFLSTLPADVEVQWQPRLSGKLDGVPFGSQAQALPFAQAPRARLDLQIDGIDLAPLAGYLPASSPASVQQGRLHLDLALDFAQPRGTAPTVKLSGSVRLLDFALVEPGGRPLARWRELSLPLTDVQPLRRSVSLGAILLDTPDLHMPRGLAQGDARDGGAPWQLALAGLQVKDGRFTPVDGLVLEAVQMQLGAVSWPLKAPTQLDASMRLDRATLKAELRLAAQAESLEARADLHDLPLERLAAWLPLSPGVSVAGRVSGQAELRLPAPLLAGAAGRAQLVLSDVAMDQMLLAAPGAPRLFSLASARLDRASIEAGAHRATLGTLRLQAPRLQAERTVQGQLNLAGLVAGGGSDAASAPWALEVKAVQVDRAALQWRDAAVPPGLPAVALAIEPLQLQLGPMRWPAAGAVSARVSGQLAALNLKDQAVAASAGRLQWAGEFGLAPLSARGRLQVQALPLHLLNAYLDPAWGLQVQRADLGLDAELAVNQQADGHWLARAGGAVRIGPLAVAQARMEEGQRVVGEDLLNWQALQLDGFQVAVSPDAPPSVGVKSAQLDEVYARLIVNEQGRLNLRDLGPAPAASGAAVPVAVAPAMALSADSIRVNRGTVDFSDRFVRPNYNARLSELQGSLGAFSSASPAMAPLTVRGRVAGTGVLEIDGQLKPGTPLAMDVRAKASDIELAPLSSYAGKYAGYAIERGKLSAQLHYQLDPGGQLVASNQLILNQLSFGDKVDSRVATSLPVRFAVALLKDRDGVIDINLPVSGSLNDPEFSVGGLVWKLLLNLLGKALTSPFSLFMGNDAPEATEVAFAPGRAELAPGEVLDRVARLLADKPGIQLTLTGWADAETEMGPLREQRLEQALKAENAPNPTAALQRLYQATKLPNKPRNLFGLAKDLPPEQMHGLLMASYALDDETLRQLAVARAVAVRDALLARGAPNARVFVAAPKLCNGSCASTWRPHVELSLGTH